MIKAICLNQIKVARGNTLYYLQDEQGVKKYFNSDELKQLMRSNQISVSNLKLTTDNRLIKIEKKQEPLTGYALLIQRFKVLNKVINIKTNDFKTAYLANLGNNKSLLWIPDDVQKFCFNDLVDIKIDSDLKVVGGKGLTTINNLFHTLCFNTLDLSELDVTNVLDFGQLFRYSTIKNVKLGIFNSVNAVSMANMFEGAKIGNIDLRSLKTGNVRIMDYMFANATIGNGNFTVENFDTSKVESMMYMFINFESNNAILDLSNFNTSNVKDMNNMFRGCTYNEIKLSNFDTSKVKNMANMFANASIERLNLSNFTAQSLIDMHSMFEGCTTDIIDLSKMVTTKVEDMGSLFRDALLRTLNISNFNTSNVSDMRMMFYRTSLEKFEGQESIKPEKFCDTYCMWLNTIVKGRRYTDVLQGN